MKALCNRALVACNKKTHDKCHKGKNASLLLGCEISIFLSSVSSSFYTDSREGITIEENVLEDEKEYQVCATLKTID